MNMKTLKQYIPAGTMTYIFICAALIVAVVLLGILPLYRYNAARADNLKKIQTSIEEQKALGNMHALLLSAAQKKDVYKLPHPPAGRLFRQDIDQFHHSFRTEAAKARLMTISLMPDVKSVVSGSQSIVYDATLKGEFANFRKVLIGLGALPYIERIEEIQIRQGGDSMELKLKMLIALTDTQPAVVK